MVRNRVLPSKTGKTMRKRGTSGQNWGKQKIGGHPGGRYCKVESEVFWNHASRSFVLPKQTNSHFVSCDMMSFALHVHEGTFYVQLQFLLA